MFATQLINFNDGKFEICEDGVKMLKSLGNEPVAVVSVCGPKGVGKSYIANVIVSRFNGKGVGKTLMCLTVVLVSSKRSKRIEKREKGSNR